MFSQFMNLRNRRGEVVLSQDEAWELMAGQPGIRLKPEVLPLLGLAGYLPPYWPAPGLAMRKR